MKVYTKSNSGNFLFYICTGCISWFRTKHEIKRFIYW